MVWTTPVNVSGIKARNFSFFHILPQVREKIAEKMQAVGRNTKGLKKMIVTWAKV